MTLKQHNQDKIVIFILASWYVHNMSTAKIKCWLLDDFWLACVTLTCHDMFFYGQDIVLKWYDITMKCQDMKF